MIGMIQDRNGRLQEVNILLDEKYRMVLLGVITSLIKQYKTLAKEDGEYGIDVRNFAEMGRSLLNDLPFEKNDSWCYVKDALSDLGIGV